MNRCVFVTLHLQCWMPRMDKPLEIMFCVSVWQRECGRKTMKSSLRAQSLKNGGLCMLFSGGKARVYKCKLLEVKYGHLATLRYSNTHLQQEWHSVGRPLSVKAQVVLLVRNIYHFCHKVSKNHKDLMNEMLLEKGFFHIWKSFFSHLW